jgi:hypothetical protein
MADVRENLKTRQLINILVDSRYRVFRHAALLLGLLMLLYSADFSHTYPGYYKYYSLFSAYIIFISMFYINMYVLVPHFFFKGQYILYFALLVVLVMAGLSSVSYFLNSYLGVHRNLEEKFDYSQGFYEGTVVSICVILVTTTLKLLQRWAEDTERISELKNLTLRMELNELRNQINPHFLFNMLNNVKSLIRTNPEMATTVVMKLSEFLRFQLYENSEDKTLLVSEITFISNFLNLEQIRRDSLLVSIENKIDSQTSRNVFVPPNLFIMFVENAVKHCVDVTDREAYIHISFAVDDNMLQFRCANSVGTSPILSEHKSSGLGLVNIKRRLALLYQDRHKLDILQTKDEYTVTLMIPL